MSLLTKFITSKIVILLFILLVIVSIILFPKVVINDSDVNYLPNDSEAKQGLVILENEFTVLEMQNKTGKVLIKNKTINEIIVLKSQIQAINGVMTVTWLDNYFNLTTTPIEFVPVEVTKNYYMDGFALLDITFIEDTDTNTSKASIKAINDLLASNGGVGFTTKSAMDVGLLATVVAMIVIVLIIILCTDSFVSAILMLVTLGCAILLNLGSNIIFGSISDITFMAAAVIQLAVSIDYSLIYLKNFKVTRSESEDLNTALILATKRSLKTILASSLTTIAGFLALSAMRYEIGVELGVVLAKGVLISLIAVILLLPALMKAFIKLVDQTEHKSLLPSFSFLGKLINGKISIIMFIILIGLTYFGYNGQNHNKFTYSNNQVELNALEKEINYHFGESNQFILIVPKGNKQSELALINEISKLSNVKSVANIYTVAGIDTPLEFVPEATQKLFLSKNYSLNIIIMDLPKEGSETFNSVNEVKTIANKFFDEAYLTGESPVILDIKTQVDKDYSVVILLSIIAIALIILFTFKSISIPIVLLLVIQSAIWINMAIPYYQGVTLSFLGYIIISSIQLGATIDYAIIYTEHYLDNRKEYNKHESAKLAITSSAKSIIISMLSLVVAGFSLTLMMDMDLIKELGILIGRGTLLSAFLSIMILPQILILFDKIIQKTTVKN